MMPRPGFYASLTAVFILLGSCFSREQHIPALSVRVQEAEKNSLSLSAEAGLEYLFETPLMPDEDMSLEIEYLLRFPPGFTNQSYNAGGPVILDLGREAWELPVDFSFLGGLVSQERLSSTNEEIIVRYAVPLAAGEAVEKALLYFNTAETRKKEEAAFLEIKNITLVKRWFGFSSGGSGSFSLSPFVYVLDSNLLIDPQSRFLSNGGMELEVFSAGETLSLKTGNTVMESSVPHLSVPSVFMNTAEPFPLTIGGEKIREARLIPARKLALFDPIPADPGMILSWPRTAWRNRTYEFFSWEAFPSILIFDMGDYGVQDRFLKRLGFYVEKAGYRGTLVPYSDLDGLHGWNAHDYRAETLADFFETARRMNMPLLDEEQTLENILLNAGIIRRSQSGNIIPGEGAILSISRESYESLRYSFMSHEGFHGLYFTHADFRDFCRMRWEAFGDTGRRFFISFLDYQYYDTTDPDLVVNEFMGYLLQQSVSRAAAYFGETRANEMINISPWRRVYLPERAVVSSSGNWYWPEIGESFSAEAAVFSRYVNQRWGFEAGSVSTVTVSR